MSSRSARAVVVAVVAAVALAVGVWARSESTRPDVTATTPTRSELRLEVVQGDPRAARLVLDDEVLGTLARDAQGNMSGDALIKLTLRAKRLGAHPVEITRAPAVDRELALATQRVLHHGGALGAVIVER